MLCAQGQALSPEPVPGNSEGWPWHLTMLLVPHGTPWAASLTNRSLTKAQAPRNPPQLTAALSEALANPLLGHLRRELRETRAGGQGQRGRDARMELGS